MVPNFVALTATTPRPRWPRPLALMGATLLLATACPALAGDNRDGWSIPWQPMPPLGARGGPTLERLPPSGGGAPTIPLEPYPQDGPPLPPAGGPPGQGKGNGLPPWLTGGPGANPWGPANQAPSQPGNPSPSYPGAPANGPWQGGPPSQGNAPWQGGPPSQGNAPWQGGPPSQGNAPWQGGPPSQGNAPWQGGPSSQGNAPWQGGPSSQGNAPWQGGPSSQGGPGSYPGAPMGTGLGSGAIAPSVPAVAAPALPDKVEHSLTKGLEADVSPIRRHAVQVGAFASITEALGLMETLKAQGHRARMVAKKKGETLLYRVLMGNYRSVVAAKEAAEAWRQETGKEALLVEE